MIRAMYLGIDVGGTKTLVASLDEWGAIQEEVKFPTPQDYNEFIKELTETVAYLTTKDFKSCGIGIPALIDHERGIGIAFPHLKWHNVPIQQDVETIAKCPVVLENDAKLAGLSESMLVKQYSRVLYVTVSTGVGAAYIVNQHIDQALRNNESGQILLEHHGKYQRWEDFAAGSAIYKRYGRPVSDIHDERSLRTIARNIAIGLIDLIAILTPDVVVLGGSVGTHYAKYGDYLLEYLKKYDNPMIQLPVIKAADRPEKAVVYGCFDLAKQTYG
jgi:predicted NBD/HSP70 family sugar kinase